MTKIISVTGDLGSGKSTVSHLLCQQLNYEYIYTGKIQREIASRYNMTTLELNQYSETHPEIDDEIDSTFKSLNDSTDLIVDSRLAWFFIPKSFKVFLKTNLIVSANRISGDHQRENETYSSTEEAVKKIIARKASENKRYRELYGVDCSDLSLFNLIVDTSFIAPERVADIVLVEYERWLDSQECSKAFVSPTNLYPTRSIRNLPKDGKANGFDLNVPVTVANLDSFDYIIDGHKRTSWAIKNHIDLLPVIYQKEIPDPVEPGWFLEWEDFHSFRYLMYPASH